MFIEYRIHTMQRLYNNIHRQTTSLFTNPSLSSFACLSQIFSALFARPDPTSFYIPVHTYLNDHRVPNSNLLLLENNIIQYNHITQLWSWIVPLPDTNQLLRAFSGPAQRRIQNIQGQARPDRFQPPPLHIYTLPPPNANLPQPQPPNQSQFAPIDQYINLPPRPHSFRIVFLENYFRESQYPIRHMIHFFLKNGFTQFTAYSLVNWWSQDFKNISSYDTIRPHLLDPNNYQLCNQFDLVHLQQTEAIYTIFNASSLYIYIHTLIISSIEKPNPFR